MKIMSALCAGLMGTALFAGGSALSDGRCGPGEVAAGVCAPVHMVDERGWSAADRAYRRGVEDGRRGYDRNEFVPRPPDVAMDGKEGHYLGYKQQRRYVDRDRFGRSDRDSYRRQLERERDRDRIFRRYPDRDADYDRRLRRHDRDAAGDFATRLLRGALSN